MIQFHRVSKQFSTGGGLEEVTMSVDKGEFMFLVGPSGAGKTTLFRLLIRETLPSTGTIIVNDWDIARLPNHKIPHLRKKIGVVFQDLKLLSNRTIFENVMLPLDFSGFSTNEAQARVEQILSRVGILSHKDKFPVQLSGGELQRAAIARALTLEPEILLADEPTGNLDANTSWEIVNLLSDINKAGTTVIMATHNNEIIEKLKKRVVKLEEGRIITDQKPKEGHEKHVPKEELAEK